MYKISNSYIDKMIDKSISSYEIDFLLYIAPSQDESGTVESVYYKDICKEIGCSIQKFYDMLTSLTEKQLITYKKVNRADLSVQFVGNNFQHNSYKKGSKGYLKVAGIDFSNEDFRKMKATAKLFYLYMDRFEAGKHQKVNEFYEKYSEMFHKAEKTLRQSLNELKANGFLYFSKKRNKAYNYEITMKKSRQLHKKSVPHERTCYFNNIKDLISRNFKNMLPEDEKSCDIVLRDVVNLLDAKRIGAHKNPVSLLIEAIVRSAEQQKNEKKTPMLNAALVNICFTSILDEIQREKYQLA